MSDAVDWIYQEQQQQQDLLRSLATGPDFGAACADDLRVSLNPLIGMEFHYLALPVNVLASFEPSQVGSVVGNLVDGCIPEIPLLFEDKGVDIGLSKFTNYVVGEGGEREGYPDFIHNSGKRVELKLLFTPTPEVNIRAPREPSGRLRVRMEDISRSSDALLVAAYQMQPSSRGRNLYSPVVTDIGVFSVAHCIQARDHSLALRGGRWTEEGPVVPAKGGGVAPDTNFGKLKRIPYKPLQAFLRKHGAPHTTRGLWPEPWSLK